jgi:hypothetical protein
METPAYLRLRLNGRSLVTLSFPNGVASALRRNRLPPDTEAWLEGPELWTPVLEHPAVIFGMAAINEQDHGWRRHLASLHRWVGRL